jgi:hypothetical protein
MNAFLHFPSSRRGLRAVAALVAGAVGLLAATDTTDAPQSKGGPTNAPLARVAGDSTGAGSGTNAPAVVAAKNAPVQPDYAYFQIISERNIFNQNRSPRSRGSGRNQRGSRAVKFDSFTLVGMMSYGKGDVAFFDGSSSEYRKSLKAAGTIAGYKVTAITNSAVILESAGKTVELQVGSQMRREEGGQWTLAGGARTDSAGGTNSVDGSVEGVTDNSSDNSSSGAGDDVLQRLLKKREQEINNEKP